MGVHRVELDGRPANSAYVSRRKTKHVLGPTILSQILEPPPEPPPPQAPSQASGAATNVGAMAARDQDVALLEAVERSIDALRSKRHLLIELDSGAAWTCAVKESDRALRTPAEPFRELAFESLLELGEVRAWFAAGGASFDVPLAERDSYAAALLRVHQTPHGGGVSFEVPRRRLLEAIVSVARHVADIHRRGRVHADLAPGNLLLCPGGPRSFDSLDVEAGAPATAATFQWAAPEQIVGHPVDPRTDVFALGKIAAALLGGVLFGEETQYVVPIGGGRSRRVELLKAEGVFVDISESAHDRKWQLAWQDLLGRSVAYDRERRPDSAVAFADELATVLDRHPPTDTLACPGRFGSVGAAEGVGQSGFARFAND
jgi:hypothetical protein